MKSLLVPLAFLVLLDTDALAGSGAIGGGPGRNRGTRHPARLTVSLHRCVRARGGRIWQPNEKSYRGRMGISVEDHNTDSASIMAGQRGREVKVGFKRQLLIGKRVEFGDVVTNIDPRMTRFAGARATDPIVASIGLARDGELTFEIPSLRLSVEALPHDTPERRWGGRLFVSYPIEPTDDADAVAHSLYLDETDTPFEIDRSVPGELRFIKRLFHRGAHYVNTGLLRRAAGQPDAELFDTLAIMLHDELIIK